MVFRCIFIAVVLAGASCQSVDLSKLPPAGPEHVEESQLRKARAALRVAERTKDRQTAAGHALLALEIVWDLGWREENMEIAHNSRTARDIHSRAMIRLLGLADEHGILYGDKPEALVQGPRGSYRVRLDPRSKPALEGYPVFQPASDFRGRGGFEQRFERPGVGLPLVAIDPGEDTFFGPANGDDAFKRKMGYAAPRTAIMLFDRPPKSGEPRNVGLALLDPRKHAEIQVGAKTYPVAADLTAPLAVSYPHFGSLMSAIGAALRPDGWLRRSELYALEHPDPERVPVVLVHGLFSTPDMWKDLINEMNAVPGIGSTYQFYVFTYPTSLPPAYSAQLFRERLENVNAHRVEGDKRRYILVGHSMGGILSRAQATDSGRAIWDHALGDRADAAWERTGQDDVIRKSMVFNANPQVGRLVFFSVPHQGAPMAASGPIQFLTRFIRFPVDLVSEVAASPLAEMGFIDRDRMPNSAKGLSPNSPFLQGLSDLQPKVPAHSVIGNRGRPGPLDQSSDGVVPYWSSHVPTARSELVVPTNHGSFSHPAAVRELERVLRLDAAEQ